MRLFLDSSVLLAACGSTAGASHEIFRLVSIHGWTLITMPYVIAEGLKTWWTFPRQKAARPSRGSTPSEEK
ncbi:MAG: hypothetical protein HY735_25770 [Verrucomicrobia bacterium]|nr:hypothetical protein [Verrucomicrobiota bacterium]